jgi:hypothetical protein
MNPAQGKPNSDRLSLLTQTRLAERGISKRFLLSARPELNALRIAFYGGTAEIQKEIISRSLGL